MDRCDTEPHWFIFASCGRPFFACPDRGGVNYAVRQFRRRWPGASVELRAGNYAAATLDELVNSWPGSRLIIGSHELDLHPAYTLVQPYDLPEAA